MALIASGVIVVLLVLYLYIVKRRANKILEVANARVQQQNGQLQDLNATKDKFFSIISHDLKGPLNSLTSFSSLLINHTDSLSKDEIRMLAKDLDKSLKNLFALLENLLEWSRSQTGNIEFKPEVFDLNVLLEQNKGLLQTQALNKKIQIENRSAGDVAVKAHKHSVNTVVRNLISNAIKFTPEGGTITLEAVGGQNGDLMVSVKDTGVGMGPEVIQKLFRLDTKHTTKGTADEKGTGLGLILCKDFIEKNGGRIWVESTPGKGSVFYFSLPRPGAADLAPLQALLQAG
jgi:signal transduction histidine kinase